MMKKNKPSNYLLKTMSLFVVSLFLMNVSLAQEMLKGGGFGVDDVEYWTVYGSGADLAGFEFGYEDDGPADMEEGCLYTHSEKAGLTNTIFFQTVTLKKDVEYAINGLIKTSEVTDFWAQIYISPELPIDGTDYKPADDANTEIYLALNTWDGCGSEVDGVFEDVSCGDLVLGASIIPPKDGDYIFSFKVGSSAAAFECFVDNISLMGPDQVGVDALTNEVVEVYPNPTSHNLVVDGMNDKFSYEIINVHGQRVMKNTTSNPTINVSNLQQGVYIINVNNGQVFKTNTFLKK